MNITFDTNAIGQVEVRGLIALLSSLIADVYPPTTQPTEVPQASFVAEPSHLAIVGAGMKAAEKASIEEKSSLQQLEESPGGVHPFNTTSTRRRRTKVEMAADALLEKTGHAPAMVPVQGSLNVSEAGDIEVQAQPFVPPVAPAPKPISAEELRSLLNAFISKHSMEEAIEKLRSFGCNRVTEALALEPAKLNELAAVLNG